MTAIYVLLSLLAIIRLLDHRDARHDAQRSDLGTAWQHRRIDRGLVRSEGNRFRN